MADGGHTFGKKTFHKPTYCHHCSDLLWGLIGQGYICEVCNFIVHEKCVTNVITPCSGIAPCLIKNPVAHCWSEPTHHKRKFCTVCRKRLDETPAVHCMICEYYAHVECQDFAIADCKENATYVPGKDLSSVKHQHHWREGNLPQSSKCAYCKKTCWSSECLTGYRCEWCGMTTHGACRIYISLDCTFGFCSPIYLPPYAVSIPRTEVPMEAIIGVQIRNSKGTPIQRDYSCPELRTIGLCDATDSELSIRQLAINFMDSKQHLLSVTEKTNRKKIDAIQYQRCLSDKTINLVNSSKLELIETTGGSDISNSSNSSTNPSGNKRERLFNKRTVARQLHTGLNRLRNDSVMRSKSFQEQNTQPRYERRLNRSRFFVKRLDHDCHQLPEYNSDDTISQNMDMLTTASSQNDCGGSSDGITEKYIYVPDKIQIENRVARQQAAVQSVCVSDGGEDYGSCYRQRRGGSNYSGHILGRIFRRMRKISLGWRKSKCKLYRGDF